MLVIRKIKDLMFDVNKYPHIDANIPLKNGIEVVKKAMLESRSCYQPMIALVFDDKKLVGTLRMRDILSGLEPNFMKSANHAQGYERDITELAFIWDTLFDSEIKELVEKPVREAMRPIKVYVEPEDPVAKAAFLMIHNDLLILPVIKEKRALVGLIRMAEVFDELSDSVLRDEELFENLVEMKKFVSQQ